jgi:hypothetical protein
MDQGSCSKIMYPNLFHSLGLKQFDLQPYDAPLVGFSGESIRPRGKIMLTVHTGPSSLETDRVFGSGCTFPIHGNHGPMLVA